MSPCPICLRIVYERRADMVPRQDDARSCRSAILGGTETLECHATALARLVAKEQTALEVKP